MIKIEFYLLVGNFFKDTFTLEFVFRYSIMMVAFVGGWFGMRALGKRLKK